MKRFCATCAISLLITLSLAGCTSPLPDALSRIRSALDVQRSAIADRLSVLRNPAALTSGDTGPQAVMPTALVASGTIEATTHSAGSTLGGRIATLAVTEGQVVRAGDVIAALDTTLLDAEIRQAVAAKNVAQAQVALLEAGAREADLDVARAAVRQAEAARDAALIAWQDAQALIGAPSDLDVKIAGAEANLRAVEEQVKASQAAATAADLEMQLWARAVKSLEDGFDVNLPPAAGGGSRHFEASPNKLGDARLQWNLASQRAWEAHAKVDTALAGRNTVRQTLADLRSQKADPQALKAQADSAKSAHDLAAAAVTTAQAGLAVLQAGAPAEQIAAAKAQVERAESAIRTLQVRREQARVLASEGGRVSELVLRAGEVAAPGAAIVRLYRPEAATLTVYVPTPDMGRVQVGQKVGVIVDSFPGRVFDGTVDSIADHAEFTPKNVQTREERAGTVFPVKIKLANSDGVLKPGMPADAHFGLPTADTGPRSTAEPDLGPGNGSRGATESAIRTPQSAIAASGSIEATDTTIAAEMSGRVVRASVAEGEAIQAGQTVVELDGSEWHARRAEATAAVSAARAELARVTALAQPARIAQAEAQVGQAQAALAAAQTGLVNARTLRDNPQELNAQINAARAQADAAVAQIDVARSQLKAARVLQESVQPNTGSDQDRTRRAMYDQNVAAAEAAVRAAEISAEGTRASLSRLTAIRSEPVALDAAVHRAESGVAQAKAAVDAAQAALAQVQAPVQSEATALAQARVAQAETGIAAVDAALAKLTVRSPVTGTVTSQVIHAGEIAQAGAPLFIVTDLGRAKLVIHVPTSQIGEVTLGQRADVTVDAYPGRIFGGAVVRIADQAEFTPKNVQTQEERAKTVFAVEIAMENSDGALRPGMPADATLRR
jgi:HlyD family secretion protein